MAPPVSGRKADMREEGCWVGPRFIELFMAKTLPDLCIALLLSQSGTKRRYCRRVSVFTNREQAQE